jgi:hypothetical protein
MLKQRQREAVRIKLLGNAIPTGTCAGRKKDWTELHCLLGIKYQVQRLKKSVDAPCFPQRSEAF